MQPAPRPTPLSVGIVATSLYSAIMLLILLLVALVGLGLSIGGASLAALEEFVPGLPMMGAGLVVLLVFMGFAAVQFLVLWSCAQAWQGSRPWTICLLVLSALGLFNPGIFSTPIQILTIVGASMALARPEGEAARA